MRIPVALLAALLVACGGGGTATVDSASYDAFRSQPTACGAERPAPPRQMAFAAPEDLGITGEPTAVVRTSCGDITIRLLTGSAPVTVNSFVFLAEQGYFDGTVSHRIAPGFVIQAGDPTATGRGGPGYRIPDELPPQGFAYRLGVVAMANGGPDTGGSQFFLVLDDIALDPDYAVFGEVIGGFEVLERIAAIPVAVNPGTLEPSYPLETVYLESVTIER